MYGLRICEGTPLFMFIQTPHFYFILDPCLLIHTYDDDYDEDDGSNDSCLIYSAYTYTYTKYIHCVSPHDNSAR